MDNTLLNFFSREGAFSFFVKLNRKNLIKRCTRSRACFERGSTERNERIQTCEVKLVFSTK